MKKERIISWSSRIAVLTVFILNVQCAISFILIPERFIAAYELSGVSGIAAIQGIGVTFLMWNVTYPLVIINPIKYRVIFGIVLVQQLVGFFGESYILMGIPLENAMLRSSIIRFIVFDGAGFILMVIPFIFLLRYCTKMKNEKEAVPSMSE